MSAQEQAPAQALAYTPSIANAVSRNLLDEYYFETLRDQSKLLARYQALLSALTPGFTTLLEDLFYLLYKIEPVLTPQPTAGRAVISGMLSTTTLKKLRGRTAGNTTESYLALKLMVDELLLHLRGTDIPMHLETLNSALEALIETRNALEDNLGAKLELNEAVKPEDAGHLNRLKSPLGLSQNASLSEVARTLAESLKALSGKKSPDSMMTEKAEDQAKPAAPKPSDRKSTDLDAKLKSSLAPDLSSFLEKLDTAMNSDHQVQAEQAGDRNQPSEKTGAPSPADEMADHLANELQALSIKMDANSTASPPDTLTPAGFDLQEMTGGDVDQKRIVDGAGLGAPVSSTTLGYSGDSHLDSRGQTRQSAGSGAGSLQQTLERLNERISHLEGQISEVLRPLDVSLAMNKTIDSIDRFTENLKSLGVNSDLEVTDDFDHVLELYKALGEPSAIRFLNKVGKKREIAKRAQYQKKRKMQYIIDKVAVGDRFDALIDEEITTLSMDVFSDDFYDRFLNRSLLVYEMEGHAARDRGPIILCYDGSGSMEGIKIEETKALLVAFIEVARIQKRRLITLQFASKTEPLYIQEFNPNHVTIEEIMRLLGHFIRGGTDFETPLKAAVELLKEDRYRRADILMITDGFSDIRDGFKKAFNQWKSAMAFKLYAIIIHGETYGDYGDLGEISDEILEIRDRDLSNWNEKISAQLFEKI
ncbi:VWA domain-containing protein [Acidaminobacter sp.]|uniref:VWA domain-containing protein n=1 Tax=Acidaminobacter sp. TaxID=1872102 RepID=UPI0025639643|nr:VWA domain-containing protein [Acidaminobacter sp.]MDK9711026.1 VWA domain-containing protein [Acidaminobacter sp.]